MGILVTAQVDQVMRAVEMEDGAEKGQTVVSGRRPRFDEEEQPVGERRKEGRTGERRCSLDSVGKWGGRETRSRNGKRNGRDDEQAEAAIKTTVTALRYVGPRHAYAHVHREKVRARNGGRGFPR